jgi:hypothetical protein
VVGNLDPELNDIKLGTLNSGLTFPPNSVGGTFSIPVYANVANNLLAYQLNVLFNPSYVQPVSVSKCNWEGSFESATDQPGAVLLIGSTATSSLGGVVCIGTITFGVITSTPILAPFTAFTTVLTTDATEEITSSTKSVSGTANMVLNDGNTQGALARRLLQAGPTRRLLSSHTLSGDANGDGKLDANDVLAVQQTIVGKRPRVTDPLLLSSAKNMVPTYSYLRPASSYSVTDVYPTSALPF